MKWRSIGRAHIVAQFQPSLRPFVFPRHCARHWVSPVKTVRIMNLASTHRGATRMSGVRIYPVPSAPSTGTVPDVKPRTSGQGVDSYLCTPDRQGSVAISLAQLGSLSVPSVMMKPGRLSSSERIGLAMSDDLVKLAGNETITFHGVNQRMKIIPVIQVAMNKYHSHIPSGPG